jgi:outer membrane immunogenic protein
LRLNNDIHLPNLNLWSLWMKKIGISAGAALLFVSPALAADLAVKAPVYKAPMVPLFTWTGCYVGADVGGAWSRQNTSINPVGVDQGAVSGNLSGSSAIGGPYVGCNYQFAGGWVVGAEGDFSWAKLNGTATAPNLFPDGASAGSGGVSWSGSTDWVASARARLGYAIVPNALVYGTGGAAWTRTSYSGFDQFNNPSFLATSFSDTRTGWVAGAGVDWAPWSNNWILRLEYLHYQFGSVSSAAAFNPGASTTFNFGDLKIDTVRAGLSYKF